MSEQHSEGPGPIPKQTVFARAEELDLAPGDDRFDRFRKAGLLDDLLPIPGTTQRGFSPAQANRFLTLLAISKTLGQEARPAALAFWLCWYGAEDVPAVLVCEHIDQTVRSALATLRREFDRKRVPQAGNQNPERWEKAQRPWGKFILKHYLRRATDNRVARELFSWIAGLALRALISPTSFDVVATAMRRVAHIIGVDISKTEALRELWAILSEGVQLFTLDEHKNQLLTAVREVNASDPKLIIALVRDARNVGEVMASVFPVFRLGMAPCVEDPSDKTRVYIAKTFAPGIVAVMALTRDVPHAIEMRRNLREGNYQATLTEFHQVKVVTDDIMRKIGIGEKE